MVIDGMAQNLFTSVSGFFSGWNYVTIVSVLLILIFAFHGSRKGLTGQVVEIISLALSIVGVALVIRVVELFLKDNVDEAVYVIIYLVVLAFLFWILLFAAKALKILKKIPIIGGINSFLGMIIGLAEGILVILALFILFEKYELGGVSSHVISAIGETRYISFLFEHNPIKLIFPL